MLILLAFGFYFITSLPGETEHAAQLADRFSIVAFLIPLNVAVFSFLKERGIFSSWGLLRIGFLLAQIAASFWLVQEGQSDTLAQMTKTRVPALSFHWMSGIPQCAVLAFVIALAILGIRQRNSKTSQDVSFIGVLFAMYIVLHNLHKPLLAAIFFATAGIILIVSIIRDSYSMAFTDELTGLPSRRALKQDMMKLGFHYAIAMLDVDHFKKFNDTHGHDTGDEVLKLVASIIKDVSGGGKAFRYGGEEFTLLFPGKTVTEAIPHLEELREKIAKRGFTKRSTGRSKSSAKSRSQSGRAGKQLFVTVSMGISQKSEKYKKPDEVMKAADSALYRAKKKGRNCVSK